VQIVQLDPSKLKPYKLNAKSHPSEQVEKLCKSIAQFGWKQPLVVDSKNEVIVGHGRLLAAQKMALKSVPCVVADDLTEEQIRLYRIADNKTAQSDWLEDLLSQELSELATLEADLSLTGFDEAELEALVQDLPEPVAEEESKSEEDGEQPELELREGLKEGTVWQLGRHKLYCGDSTDSGTITLLFNGKTVDSLVCDPPYGVDYGSKNEALNKLDNGNRIQTPINNDAIEDYRKFFTNFIKNIPFSEYNTFYIFMSDQELHNLRLALDDCRCKWSNYIIWAKNNHVLGRKDYHAKHEIIIYGWKGKHKFYGEFSTTILDFNKPTKNDLHPTMKPVELIEKLIQDGSPYNGIIYDPFLGSGTTLIASENTNRICYGCELSPHYCEVIMQRWEKLTKKTATLIGNI
jgi:DNA modification methylase